jgi:flagellar basal body-associated protein FliL
MKTIIKLEEQIPFKDTAGNIMQMVQYSAGVTIEQEEGETLEELENKARALLEKQLEYFNSKDTAYLKQKRISNFLLSKLKEKLDIAEYRSILAEVKSL